MMSLGAYFHFFNSPSSLQPSHPCPLFCCPLLLAASTCNPPHNQWLTGLGVGAGSLGLLAHSCGGCLSSFIVVSLSIIVAHSPHCPYCCCLWQQLRVLLWCLGYCFITMIHHPVIHPTSCSSQWWCR
jgi:hypothetical protein